MLAPNRSLYPIEVHIGIEPDFDFLSAEYRAFHNLERATVFQAPAWLDAVHRKLLPHLSAKQYTLTIRNPDRQLLAVIPLVLQRPAGISMLLPADFGVCDYNAVVGDPATLEMLVADPSVIERIDGLLDVADVLVFRKVRDDGFDASRLFRKTVASPNENAAYHSETGPDFEVWQRERVSKKYSKELRRLARQIEREFGPYEHRPAQTEAEVRDAFRFLKSARDGRFSGDFLDNPVYEKFYCDFAVAGLASGDAITYVSYLNGEPVAVLFGPACDDEFHAVLIGSDIQRFGKFSIGMQLIYRVIKLRFDHGMHRLDMGLGNTGYKSQFRVEQTGLQNFTSSRSLAGSMVSFVYHRAKPFKRALSRLSPHVR
ncbi:GNAT family N-acetyltransferase [Bradyrhizobium sp. WSM 1704]|uniref:GNAT family N-acetyltransferase n=1 Tax=Bradyrhizobium semiaridum TaxID=2821404 RepID=UPI001CE24053|nr:GNAT family N-acetyltransferase [Bradyrhizobium semiaridum]MCA6126129.1 GNAT family N-acetyltransferase [Bradyrhizobium semiaridum]